jgi:hypothetical protein
MDRRPRRAASSTKQTASRWRGLACAAVFVFVASSAAASPGTLRLGFEDVLVGAVDVAVSPVNAGMATYQNLDKVSDNGFLQALYVVPGFVGLSVMQAGQAVLRIVVGVLEIPAGLALLPFETDVPESFNVFRRGPLLADLENPLGEQPAWLAYVIPLTPITIDARIAPMCPWARYDGPGENDRDGYANR